MLQTLPIALAQAKVGSSEHLLNDLRKSVYFLYQSEEITKKVYNNIINTKIKMDTIFINFKNSKKLISPIF